MRASVADSSQSVQDQANAQIAAEASALGFVDAATKAGAAGSQAGSETADAFGKASQSIDSASIAAGNLATNAAAAGTAVAAFGSATQRAAAAQAALGTSTQGIVLLSADQLRLLKEIGQEFLSGAISGEEYARRVQVAMGGVDQELIKQEENLRNFQNALDELNSEIAGETGDTKSQEDIRHAQKLRDLKDEFEVQGTLTSQQYQQLIKAENELHALKLKNAQQEQNANTSAHGGSAGNGGTPPPSAPTPPPGNTTQRGTSVPGLTVDFSGTTIIGGNEKQLGEILARIIKPALDQIARRSL